MKTLGNRIDKYESLESTHLLAKSLKDEEIQNGMVIVAENQTAGIGTHGRQWQVESGKNLCFDVILLPNCNIKKIQNLTIIIAECIQKTLEDLYKIKTTIKKPNDVMLNGRKLAGILTESITTGENVKKIFIGIGININQKVFPEELEEIATSLKKEYKKEFSKEEVLNNFLEIFEQDLMKQEIL